MNKYSACDFYITRMPLLPIENYFNVFTEELYNAEKNNVFELFQTSFLKECLIVASKDLYEAINRMGEIDSSKSSEQMVSALIKYFIRLTTRPTPFGLFSGISVGNFKEKSSIIVSQSVQNSKRARADMEWIYLIIKKIESDTKIRNLLKIRFNDFSYVNGNRLEKPNRTYLQKQGILENEKKEIAASVRYTKALKIIEEKCKTFQPFYQVVDMLKEDYPEMSINRIESFISQLLDNEFLLSELRPPLINTDVLEYILHILYKIKEFDGVSPYITSLEAIKKSISIYNTTAIGKGLDEYTNIITLMSSVCENKNYLQVDMKTKLEDNSLGYELRGSLEEFVAAMYKITPAFNFLDEYNHYKNCFIEKYGYGTEICVLDLLDVDRGIGVPSYYLYDTIKSIAPRRQKTEIELRLESVLKRKKVFALRNNKKSIEINEDDINYISDSQSKDNFLHPMDYLQSFELYLIAHTGEKNALDGEMYDFTLAPVFASSGLGKSGGRFGDMLSENELLTFNKEIEKQKELLSDYIIAEIAELPERGRTSNVSLNNSSYDYQIMLSTNYCDNKKYLSIRDLFIGVDPINKQFYIRSKSLNKKIIVTMSNMLNPLANSNVVRFLREISSVRRFDVTKCIAEIISTNEEYCPRITYKRIIIKPETWVISKDVLGLEDNTWANFFFRFNLYKNKWKMPRYVFLTEFDNRLLLDLENNLHVHEIYNIMRNKNTNIKLAEMTCCPNNYSDIDKNGKHYVTEVVVPFVFMPSEKYSYNLKHEQIIPTQSNIHCNRMEINREQLILVPGKDNWLFYKLYGCSKRMTELLSIIYTEFEKLIECGKIKKYFFIRYSDPESHIRIRIQAMNNELPYVFEFMCSWLESTRCDGLISKVVIDSYQREAERYGGLVLIKKAEEYFYCESRIIMEMIYKRRYENSLTDLDYIGVGFIALILRTFNLTMRQAEAFMLSIVDQKLFKKEYQRNRKLFIQAVALSDNMQQFFSFSDNYELYNLFVKLQVGLKDYVTELYTADSVGLLTNSIQDIMASIIHMFSNRLVGEALWEQKIYALTRHGLHGLSGYLEHIKK